MSQLPSPTVPACPNGIFIFPPDSVVVEDADEEIMELYMNLASISEGEGVGQSLIGLGFLDSTQSVLKLSLELAPPLDVITRNASQNQVVKSKGRKQRVKKLQDESRVLGIDVQIHQDLTALKGRKGETGSVLWRSSLHLARDILLQNYYPSTKPLLQFPLLKDAHVLELGSGTGLLAVLLSRLCGSYTASDKYDNLRLVQRNLELNGVNNRIRGSPLTQKNDRDSKRPEDVHTEVILEEIDWVDISKNKTRYQSESPNTKKIHYDVVLAVDCIYNEHLVQPFIDTLTTYCPVGGRTVVWVVVELRSAEVLTTFLKSWLDDSNGRWTVVRLGDDAMGDWMGRRPRWVGIHLDNPIHLSGLCPLDLQI
ncbi:uncharacterized protein L203_104031 [Cryptococcus depauperatus CBS 7841]|uniref:Uncharacterized protein n=1 Tax=Cryptococcus depauperatus CBS 7841 TaxID=1295531 RepID=A0AAJ8M2L4_9TREE